MGGGVGDILNGRYALRREISRGLRCAVFEADDVLIRRSVALKLAHGRPSQAHQQKDALVAEARLLAEIRHQCIVHVLDAGTAQTGAIAGAGAPYIVMEMLEGRSLAGVLAARGKLRLRDTVRIAMALCRALACIHSRGVVHLDLGPHNVFLPPDGAREWDSSDVAAKVLGFGTAVRAITADADDAVEETSYLPPEQLDGGSVDKRCDIYALGVIIYECLTGKLPSARGERADKAPSPNQLQPEISGAFSDVVMRALSEDPESRFPDGRAFAAALWRAKDVQPEKPAAKPDKPPEPDKHAKPAQPEPPPAASRRKTPRAAYITPVRVIRQDGSRLDSTCEDISQGGMLLLASTPLQSAEQVQVRFALPISGTIVEVAAVARWAKAARGGKGAIGIQFENLPEDAGDAIGKYVTFFGEGGG